MSSPLSNLKKGRKTPLINATRAAPFKPNVISEEELFSQLNFERKLNVVKNEERDIPSNSSLLSSMVSRLADVEKKLVDYETLLRQKDKEIDVLKNKCDIYQRAKGYGNDQIGELERKCHKLQRQVHGMENFLEDYGMIWVGNPNSSDEDDDDNVEDDFDCEEKENLFSFKNEMWNPNVSYQEESVFQMNFDLVLRNIKELNSISGEGEHFIKHTKDCAKLEMKEPVPLTFYGNGIFMFGGPFRSYEDPSTQLCVQDIMDGYFPSELQTSYPDGVPFKVEDKRNILFKDKRLENLFPGQGKTLSPEKRKVVQGPCYGQSVPPGMKTETIDDIGTHKHSIEKFLSNLPRSVMKNGKIIDIRDGIKEALTPAIAINEVVVIETDAVKDIKARVNSGLKSRPSTASAVTTLRIKGDTGDQTYMLKMRYTDKIRDVKNHLDETRNDDGVPYVLKTSFPNQTYDNLDKTLKEYGLVPNATLHVVKTIKI